MIVLYVIIILLIIAILFLLYIVHYILKKEYLIYLSKYEKKLIFFVIDMYLSYGESINIFPDDEKKDALIKKIIELKKRFSSEKEKSNKNK